MLYYKAEKICLRDHLTNDVVSCCSQQWDCKKSELRLYVPSVCSKLTDSLCCAVWLLLPALCLCPFLRIEKQTLAKYLPAMSGASARHPAAHKGRVLCVFRHVCVRVSVVFGKVSGCQGVLRLFPSPLCQHCVRAFVCAHPLCDGSWLKGTHGSELNRRPKGQIQLSTVLLPLSFSITIVSKSLFTWLLSAPHSPTVHFSWMCICVQTHLCQRRDDFHLSHTYFLHVPFFRLRVTVGRCCVSVACWWTHQRLCPSDWCGIQTTLTWRRMSYTAWEPVYVWEM